MASVGIQQLARDFIGLETMYGSPGARTRRRYLDSAATTLMMKNAASVSGELLAHYGSPHADTHRGARVASASLRWVRDVILSFLDADPMQYAVVLSGSGATACANRVAHRLFRARPARKTALVSAMEHHSNDLPHRREGNVRHIELEHDPSGIGALSLSALDRVLEECGQDVNYVALTAVSNVTGIINPTADAARLAHRHGALLVVDATQMIAHLPCRLGAGAGRLDADALFFSGHKVYAPGAPGVLVVKRSLLRQGGVPFELGGGMVSDVSEEAFRLLEDDEAVEQAGTPNVVGAVALAAALETLRRVGMEVIHAREQALLRYAWQALASVGSVQIYGATDLERVPRIGCIAFNLHGHDHASVATRLNDEFEIAVRSGCFCAHPYVRLLLKDDFIAMELEEFASTEAMEEAIRLRRGMVRASFGVYSTEDDVDALVSALCSVAKRPHAAAFARPAVNGGTNLDDTLGFHPAAALERALQRLEVQRSSPRLDVAHHT